MESKRKKKNWPKYRIQEYVPFGYNGYHVQEKKWLFGKWWHVGKSVSNTFEEAVAVKTLLENGESLYHTMKPEWRCKLLGLQLNP